MTDTSHDVRLINRLQKKCARVYICQLLCTMTSCTFSVWERETERWRQGVAEGVAETVRERGTETQSEGQTQRARD